MSLGDSLITSGASHGGAAFGVAVSGIPELQEQMNQLKRATALRGMRQALTAASEFVLKDMKRRCPEAPRGHHGRYPGRLKQTLFYWVGSKHGNPTAWVGPNEDGWYAHFVEFGTRAYQKGDRRVSDDGKSHGYVKKAHAATQARPFMRPAIDKNVDDIVRIFGEELDRFLGVEIEKARRRAARPRGWRAS